MRIFSGIQPTGRKHLGNYIGAISRYVEGQERAEREGGESIFCIVDLHAISVAYEPAELRERLYDTTAILLAAGLDPDRCTLFRQSDVREHTELTWLLSAVTAHGDLNRMTQFKEKAAKQRELVSAALFLYPMLQVADVLAYKADEVPVGDDQRQHIELTRDVARRFNERFAPDAPILVVPELRVPAVGGRVMDLQEPTMKMSTTGGTEQGTVLVLDPEKTVRKKIMSAVTDSGSEVRASPDKPGISNLIEILSVTRGIEPAAVEAEFAGSGYGDFKRAVADAVVEYLGPVRERYEELRHDEAGLERTLQAVRMVRDELPTASLPPLSAVVRESLPTASESDVQTSDTALATLTTAQLRLADSLASLVELGTLRAEIDELRRRVDELTTLAQAAHDVAHIHREGFPYRAVYRAHDEKPL